MKLALIALGFLFAAAAAWLAVEVRQRFIPPADLQASAGMHAEGDAILGLLVFCAVGVLPLGLALFWLRAVPVFWRGLSWLAVAVAVTAPFSYYAFHAPGRSAWLMVFGLRVLLAPFIGGGWGVCGLFAPQKRERWLLLAAAAAEGALFAAWLGGTLLRSR